MAITTIQPYSDQEPVIQAVHSALNATGKALVVMACGLGKTICAAFVVKEFITQVTQGRVLFLCHDNGILRQAMDEFRSVMGPDVTMGLFNGVSKTYDEVNIVFGSLQTFTLWKDAFFADEFDLVIVDEGHRGKATTWEPVIEYFKSEGRIGLTATPERMDGKDIQELFGPPVVNISLEEGIASGRLARVEYHLISDTFNTTALRKLIREVLNENRRVSIKQLNETIFVDQRDDEVVEIIESYEKKKAIVFCECIEHAERMVEFLPNSAVYHSHIPNKINEETLQTFREGTKYQYLVAVDKLNEGIDVPDVDMIVFLRCTDSKRIFLQQLGRGLRKIKGKDMVVVLDFVGNIDRVIAVSQFVETVQELSENGDEKGFVLDSEVLEISEEGSFKFIFTKILVDLIEMLKRMDVPFYPTYAEASAAAQKLGVRTMSEYNTRYKEDPRLPSVPFRTYGDEWISFYHFFGKGDPKGFYPTLAEASVAAQKLGFLISDEYKAGYKKDPRLPSNPNSMYKNWVSWQVFLGTGSIIDFYPTLAEASAAAQKLGISSGKEYESRYLEDSRLPSTPRRTYEGEWDSWADFLGRESKDFYPTLAEASAAAQKLGISSRKEYKSRYVEDSLLPSVPRRKYEGEWDSWPDFLGTGTRKRRKEDSYPTLAEASAAVQRLGIRTKTEYKDRYTEDPMLHSNPNTKYETWDSWSDFLGIGIRQRRKKDYYPTYAEASAVVQKLGIRTIREYKSRYTEDPMLCCSPNRVYEDDWDSWPEFLGTSFYFYPTLAEASAAAQSLGFLTGDEYRAGYKKDSKLPSDPNKIKVYEHEWISWPDFLGTGTRDFYPTLAEASAAAQKLGIRTYADYQIRYKEDSKLPSTPKSTYKKDKWISWPDFLGTGTRDFYSLSEASAVAQKLGIRSCTEYMVKKRYHEDPRLPSTPHSTYEADWISWPNFLGADKK